MLGLMSMRKPNARKKIKCKQTASWNRVEQDVRSSAVYNSRRHFQLPSGL